MNSRSATNPYLQSHVPGGKVCTLIAGLCLIMVPAYASSDSNTNANTDAAACITDIAGPDTPAPNTPAPNTAALAFQEQEPATGQVQEPPPLPPSPAKPRWRCGTDSDAS